MCFHFSIQAKNTDCKKIIVLVFGIPAIMDGTSIPRQSGPPVFGKMHRFLSNSHTNILCIISIFSMWSTLLQIDRIYVLTNEVNKYLLSSGIIFDSYFNIIKYPVSSIPYI